MGSADDKSVIERLDVALTAVLKVTILGLVAMSVMSLTLCSDDSVKAGRAHVERRLALIGFKPSKFALGGLELQAIAASTTGAEAQNVQGLAEELKRLSARGNGAGLTDDLRRLAADVDAYSQQLVTRDAKVVAQVRQAALPVSAEAAPVTAWIYLGRRNADGRWAPLSDKVTLDDLQRPTRVTPVKDVVLVERDPAAPPDPVAASADAAPALRLLRAGSPAQAVMQLRETDSIGQAKMLWAQVAVAPKDLSEISVAAAR